jgi:uncharacterized SAM-binding protein YcdF (DUF218 family)
MFRVIKNTLVPKKLRSSLQILTTSSFVFVICLLVLGFYSFSTKATQEADLRSLPRADGIVVLTGEESRIHYAIKLLQARHGKRLLISGVSTKVSDRTVLNTYALDNPERYCCIDMDRLSLDTKGNAKHTAEWISLHDFKRVIVVTSSYHMPRSLEHLRKQMPSVEFIPAQMMPSDLKGNSNFAMMASSKVLIEYGKYLVTKLHLEPVLKYVRASLDFNNTKG